MLVSATRRFSALTLRAFFYVALFLFVAMAQVGLTTAFRAIGLPSGVALAAAGAIVLLIVMGGVQGGESLARRRAEAREIRRRREGLPAGPCCVVWRAAETQTDMLWELVAPLRVTYPDLARRLGVEGVAVVHFEIGAGGEPKNMHCVDVWPSTVFYQSARDALGCARFQPRPDMPPRFGTSYRMPFVFRIAGATRPRGAGAAAKQDAAALPAPVEAVEKLHRIA